MTINSKVVWSEGLFLQPQHFQQQERYFEHLIMSRPSASGYTNWGITELEIDQRLLALGKIGILRCKGILPDGTAFSIPEDNYAPVPLDIPSNVADKAVYLVLPLLRAGQSQIASTEEEHAFFRYRSEALRVVDVNSGSNDETHLQVGRLSFRLLIENEDRGGYTGFAIARIKESFADQQVRLDEQFIPSCLDVNAVPKLSHFIKELLGLLKHRGDSLIQYMTDAGHSGVSEVADFMLLQLINRSEMICEFFVNKKGIHPEQLFCYLIQLTGELSTFTNKSRRPKKIPLYYHNDLQNCFDPIIQELRHALSMVLEQGAVPLVLEKRKYGISVSPVVDRALLENAEFILGVKADLAPEMLRSNFIKQVKIAPVEIIQSLISRALPGIDLQSLVVVPRQIPFNVGFVYFSLDKSHEYWNQLKMSAGIAIHIGNNFPGLELQFWAIRGNMQ